MIYPVNYYRARSNLADSIVVVETRLASHGRALVHLAGFSDLPNGRRATKLRSGWPIPVAAPGLRFSLDETGQRFRSTSLPRRCRGKKPCHRPSSTLHPTMPTARGLFAVRANADKKWFTRCGPKPWFSGLSRERSGLVQCEPNRAASELLRRWARAKWLLLAANRLRPAAGTRRRKPAGACRRRGFRAPPYISTSIWSFSVSSLYRLRIVTSVTPATSATSRCVRRELQRIDAM